MIWGAKIVIYSVLHVMKNKILLNKCLNWFITITFDVLNKGKCLHCFLWILILFYILQMIPQTLRFILADLIKANLYI